jgi:hypothetical protein
VVHPLQPSAGTGTGRIEQDGLYLERTGQEGEIKTAHVQRAGLYEKGLVQKGEFCMRKGLYMRRGLHEKTLILKAKLHDKAFKEKGEVCTRKRLHTRRTEDKAWYLMGVPDRSLFFYSLCAMNIGKLEMQLFRAEIGSTAHTCRLSTDNIPPLKAYQSSKEEGLLNSKRNELLCRFSVVAAQTSSVLFLRLLLMTHTSIQIHRVTNPSPSAS